MIWFLRLFRSYRAMEAALSEMADRFNALQDRQDRLTGENSTLINEIREAREAQVAALKMMANIGTQSQFGGMPPYPEVYSLPAKVEYEPGPIATNRVHGREAVREGIDAFHAKIRELAQARRGGAEGN